LPARIDGGAPLDQSTAMGRSMAPRKLLPLGLACAAMLAAGSAVAQSQLPTPESIQKMYDAPVNRLYGDPMRKYDPSTGYADPARNLYGRNPMVPGGAPTAPHTYNESAPNGGLPADLFPPNARAGAARAPSGADAAADARFRRFDLDRNGAITRDEFVNSQMMRAPGTGLAVQARRESLQRRFDSRFGGADRNHDGRITPDEYLGATNPRF
jgi:hypothetical protein